MAPRADSRSADRLGFSPLRHRDFRVFWTALLLSSVGSQFTTVAIAWQVYELTNSPLQLGLIGLA
ncbi:MAG TPA: MFS transporter, partial [Candidatus Binatia bacterium]